MSYVTAIVLAAGSGLRFSRLNSFTVRGGIPTHISKMIKSGKSKIPKPLVKINSRPIIIYCLNILSRHAGIRDIIVVTNPKNLRGIISKIRQYRIDKISRIVQGGRRRQDSVLHALKAMDNRTDLVLIHDGARPFIDKETVSSVIKEAERFGAAIVGVPVKATIKKITKSLPRLRSGLPSVARHHATGAFTVKETLDRRYLWEVQTPQVFKKELILKAYKRFGKSEVTDDASLVEKLGAKVKIVKGSYSNIKVTTPEDLILAEAIAKRGLKRF